MNSKNLKKKLLVLVFLAVVFVGVFLFQDNNSGQKYFSWLKTKIVGLGTEINLTQEDPDLDMTSIDMESLLSEKKKDYPVVEEDDGLENLDTIIKNEPTEEVIISEDEKTKEVPLVVDNSEQELLRIKEQIDRISKEVERITQEVERLTQQS